MGVRLRRRLSKIFHLDSPVFNVFLIVQVGLDPLQLVLMGTILEATYLVFEVPTGVIADTRGRRTSFLLGTITLALVPGPVVR